MNVCSYKPLHGLSLNGINERFNLLFRNVCASAAKTALLPTIVSYANDAAAATGGVVIGGLYNSSGTIKIRLV